MKQFIGVCAAIMILLLTGCASVPMAPLDQDAQAKQFLPVPKMAALYIYRNETFGAAIPMTVTVNGKALGQTASKTYFRLNVIPGKYTIESHAESISNLPLSVEAEKLYFVWQEVKMGVWMARSMLQSVDEKTGRSGVMESQLIASSVLDRDVVPLDTVTTIVTPPAPTAASGSSITERLREIQNLRKEGAISEEEFQIKRQQLLEKL